MFSPLSAVSRADRGTFAVAIARKPIRKRFDAWKHGAIRWNGSITSGTRVSMKVSGSDLLDRAFPGEEIFRNKIVLMGYIGEDNWAESINDKLYTPPSTRSIRAGHCRICMGWSSMPTSLP